MNKKKAAYRKLAKLLGVGKYFNLSQINVDKAIQSYIFRKSSAIPKYRDNIYVSCWFTNRLFKEYPDELIYLGIILTLMTQKYLVFREPFVTTENDINIIHENDMFIPDEQHKFENIRLPDWMIPWLMNDADESVLSIMNKFIIEVLCQMEYTDLEGFLNEFHSVISTSTSLEIITLMHKNSDETPINDNRFLL
jgi:hypothetical protein